MPSARLPLFHASGSTTPATNSLATSATGFGQCSCGGRPEREIAQLVLAIGVINLWNRLSITFRAVPGSMDKLFGLDKVGLH